MNKNVTFDEAIEEIKSEGSKVKQNIVVAEKVADIINAIVKARIQKKVSQRDLAEKTGIKQSTIARMETLQTIPRIDTLIRIADCLGVRIEIENTELLPSSISTIIMFPNTQYSDYGWNTDNYYQTKFPKAVCGGA